MMLTNKTILITGVSGGIGLACAERAISEGAYVVGTYRTMNDRLSEISQKYPEKIKLFRLDVSEKETIAPCIKKAVSEAGGIDAVINCIGITSPAPLFSVSPEDWERTVETDLFSIFRIMQSVVIPLVSRKGGSIVNLSSVFGTKGGMGQSSYCASKAGIEGLTRAAASELAGKKIRINAVAPGFIETPMTDGLDAKFKENALSRIPAKRFGKPEEVAALCLFLVSDDAAYITGQVFTIDGGLSCHIN